MKRQRGLTLVEIMITISILTIAITLVVPGMQSLLLQQRIIASLNATSASLQFAKSHSISQMTDVSICPTVDYTGCVTDWGQAKMIFVDTNGNNQRDATETLLQTLPIVQFGVTLTSSSDVVRFYMSGLSASPSTLLFCDQSEDNQYARAIFISLQGRISTSLDSDNDGIYESNSGVNLSCSE